MPRRDRYLQHLARVPLFQTCSQRELAAIGRLAEHYTLDPGTVVVHEGRRESEFYLILDGQAKVTRGDKQVATLGPGDYFGELAVLVPGPRNASVIAETQVELLGITSHEFWHLLDEVPSIARKVLVGTARRLHEADGRAMR
jgi:CRP/FNR family cyclic AMP-dependent transcriptional regulator